MLVQDCTNRKSFPGKLFLIRTSGCFNDDVELDIGRHRRRLRVICDGGGGGLLEEFVLRLLVVGRSDFPCDTVGCVWPLDSFCGLDASVWLCKGVSCLPFALQSRECLSRFILLIGTFDSKGTKLLRARERIDDMTKAVAVLQFIHLQIMIAFLEMDLPENLGAAGDVTRK